MNKKQQAQVTVDLLIATKAVVERDVGLGIVTENQLRLTIEARKEKAKELKDKGLSTRQIAKVTGASQRTIARDVSEPNGSKREPNDPPTKADGRAAREAELAANQVALPDKSYGVIYAEPAWRFEPYSRDTGMDRAADNHYPTMTVDQIEKLQVPAADDCVLFLWATAPMLLSALDVMETWGFEYRSHFIWNKNKIGTGYWARNAHELLLVGVRGDIPAPAPGEQYPSVITAMRTEHSTKPSCFREMIEEMFPNLPRI